MEFAFHIDLIALPGRETELKTLLDQADAHFRHFDGCLNHVVTADPDDPSHFTIDEAFVDEAAHQAAVAQVPDLAERIAACAAATRAIGMRNGEQDT